MSRQKGKQMALGTAVLPAVIGSEHLSQLFRDHHRRVLLAAWRITGNMADAEDVAQAVFLRLLSSADHVVDNASSYLYRAAVNGALDTLRRRRQTEPLEVTVAADPAAGPEAYVAERELVERLRIALSELPARPAEIFALRYIEQLGNREIAQLMGTSQAVVAVTLHQTRGRLKKRLAEVEGTKR
jgi:RNA polymerase sigma factor (sigma-70 family)